MTISSQRNTLARHLVQAARGHPLSLDLEKATIASEGCSRREKSPACGRSRHLPLLPCFSLQQHHFGQIPIQNSASLLSSEDAKSNGTFSSPATPSDFHSYLCTKIRQATDRVVLASLYIGVGSNENVTTMNRTEISDNCLKEFNSKEDELLHALKMAATNQKVRKIQVLMDANRATRKVSYSKYSSIPLDLSSQTHGDDRRSDQTCSADVVSSKLNPLETRMVSEDANKNGVFLFHVNDKFLSSLLPSPLGEVLGVFHMKAYIIDDELILSGANLSEEYFTNRLDRYILFINGGGGLVDFYVNLCDALCEYAVKYQPQSTFNYNSFWMYSSLEEKNRKQKLEMSVMKLFDGQGRDWSNNDNAATSVVAYAIPTFQMPRTFMGRLLNLHSDTIVTHALIQCALKKDSSTSIRLSSAYLNVTPNLQSVFKLFRKKISMSEKSNNTPLTDGSVGVPYILTAGPISHGFAPKRENVRNRRVSIVQTMKDLIPHAFLRLVMEIAPVIFERGGKVLMYERVGWTFHAKGIWVTAGKEENVSATDQQEYIQDPSTLVSTIIGSGNYGARSEFLDVESNCILIFNDDVHCMEKRLHIQQPLAAEWNHMCEQCTHLTDLSETNSVNKVIQIAIDHIKRFL